MEPLRPNHPQRLLPPHGTGVAACGGPPRFRCRQGPDASAATPGLSDTHRRFSPSVSLTPHPPRDAAVPSTASVPAPSGTAAAPSGNRSRTLRGSRPHLPGPAAPSRGLRPRPLRSPRPSSPPPSHPSLRRTRGQKNSRSLSLRESLYRITPLAGCNRSA